MLGQLGTYSTTFFSFVAIHPLHLTQRVHVVPYLMCPSNKRPNTSHSGAGSTQEHQKATRSIPLISEASVFQGHPVVLCTKAPESNQSSNLILLWTYSLILKLQCFGNTYPIGLQFYPKASIFWKCPISPQSYFEACLSV